VGESAAGAPPGAASAFRAGAASADITPADLGGTFLAGFGLDRRAEGVLEPLAASALHLESGDVRVVLVSADLLALPRPLVDEIRARVSAAGGQRAILCCATHTHSGPDTLGLWGRSLFGKLPIASGVDRAYLDWLAGRVASCVDEAAARAVPARLRAASFAAPARWTRNDRRGGARFDHAAALAVEDREGRRIATLVNYASHPETLWSGNRLVSPDFPGAFRRRSAQLAGGVPLYVSGPLGAMLTPDLPREASDDERRRFCDALGTALAELAEEALAGAAADPDPVLRHAARSVRLPNANWRFRLFQRLGWLPARIRDGCVENEVHWLRLGDVEAVSAPGEVAPELGARMRAGLRARHRLILGLCDDEVGYVLEPGMFDDPEYRYEATVSLGRDTAALLLAAQDALVAEGWA
jgi:hypothetical protein